jgi:isopentenyl diphosphate isomerase/L-lactate dehydrogenase-like FMN-dependent dehydrogenase
VTSVPQLPADVVASADYERYARERLPREIFAHIAGGSGEELALRANRAALEARRIYPRPLVDCRQGSTATTLLGEAFAHPILLAPVAYQQLVHPDGELATARAAAALDTGMVVSTLASTTLEQIAAELPRNKWFQLYFQRERHVTRELVERAERAGYTALVVTVDLPVTALRNRAARAGFRHPASVAAANLHATPPPDIVLERGASRVFQGVMATAPTWDDIRWLRSTTRLPLLLKGLLHPDDVIRAAELGANGAVVSNHGGRALDEAPAALDALQAIRRRMPREFPLLVDGGLRSGGDVFKALALGAQAVLIGRPQLYALALAGAVGVAHLLRVLRDELEVTMALAGCPTLEHIGESALTPPADHRC